MKKNINTAKTLAISAIQKQKTALESISKEGTVYQVGERFRLWFKKTIDILREHIIEDEILQFGDFELEQFDEIYAIQSFEHHFKDRIIALLEGIQTYPEQLLVSTTKPATHSGSPLFAMMHPTIIKHAKVRFENEQFADAVESALKEVNVRVKHFVKSQTQQELDGTGLMTQAFSPRNPIIKIADLNTQSGKDEQDGYARIFAGTILGIRNPKAHDNLIITPERCIHLLMLASLLMFKLDDAGIPIV